MWMCPKCRENLEDQFESCWKCAGQKQPDIQVDDKPQLRPSPSFGIASVLSPVGIFLAVAVIPRQSDSDWGYGGVFLLILVGFLSLLGGFISALIGIFRGEKPILWSLFGLVINASMFFYVMTFDSGHHHRE
jgi:hypothetical protein